MNTIVANKQQPNISFKSPINKDEFKLKIKLTKEVAIQWHETYLSKDQTLKVVDNGDLLLEATIDESTHSATIVMGNTGFAVWTDALAMMT